ncbi:glucose ABC transporter permease GlcU [Candidatus Acidianus copahuensis]
MRERRVLSPYTKSVLHYIALTIVSVIWLIPVYAMIINGFKSNLEVASSPVLVPPSHPTLSPYMAVAHVLETPIINSLIVAVIASLLSTILGSMGAYFFYVLSNSYFRGSGMLSNFLFSLIALGTFIPYEATLIPLTRFIVDINLLNSYPGLIVSMLIFYIPTAALLMSLFVTVVPKSLIEAARLDGAGDVKIFFKVILPLVIPGFISTLIFIIIESWNNFFLPLVLTTTPSMRLVPVAVEAYTGGYGTLYNETFAVATLASLIPLIIFIFLGRYFIRGLVALGGAGKGV